MRAVTLAVMAVMACKSGSVEKPATTQTGTPVKPSKLEPLERVRQAREADAGPVDTRFEIAPFAVRGPTAPAESVGVKAAGDLSAAAVPAGDAVVRLDPEGETYLAQVLPFLSALDDANRTVWLSDPRDHVAFRIDLRDEAEFQRWVDDPTPGKLRIIQRADGFELQTNMGKLPGADPNGPSVPNRGGLDLPTLNKGLLLIKGRFKDAKDVCFVPTWGTSLADIAHAMQANFFESGEPIFSELCLVYPRPAVDAGP